MDKFKKYMNHLPNCYKMQNWDAAFQALADLPESIDKNEYYKEINRKRNICTCGLDELLNEIDKLSIPSVNN